MRGVNSESRAMNNTMETINAAANAIASAENRVPQDRTVQVNFSCVFFLESNVLVVFRDSICF